MVGIEILPAYYENFLKERYPDVYFDLPAAFQSVDQATEAIELVVDAWKRQGRKPEKPLSETDKESPQNVVSYIADHYAFDIPLERLASIACMSETKLKSCFNRQFGCSVTQ